EGLEKLDVPGPEQVAEAGGRLAALVAAADEMPSRLEELEALTRKAEEAAAAGIALDGVVSRLAAIRAPADLETLIDDRASAMERLAAAIEAQGEVIAARAALDAALAGYPERQALERWHADRGRLAVMSANRIELGLDRLVELANETTTARDRARARLEETRMSHAAHQLRQGLDAGGTCPVCHGVVTTVPATDPGDAASLDRLGEEALELESAAAEARDRLKEAEGQAKQIDQAIAELEEGLLGAPPQDEVEAALGAVKSLLATQDEIGRSEELARQAVEEAEVAVSRLEERSAALREALLTGRDAVVDEGPPLPGDDVIAGWRVFETWRADRISQRRSELEVLTAVIEGSELAVSAARSGLASWLAGLGVEPAGSPQTDLALAIERRSNEVRELEKTLADSIEMKAELEIETGRARVASALGTHLRANNFEAWLLEEAMEVLIDGANRLLGELSGGGYSLRVKESQFEVVDHRNARLTRTTRSLSGGEIFLVALSLALSMADQLAALTGMSSRLESVFLDEGFGSLDQESLDVVATVLDELVGRGRTVGIVTHVRELAERMPTRFEVVKGPETASIVRVGE
ncbi:MAG TPA: SbcC/MukB-like Walker B domain-containing protein, partial [Acidimicrobiia bacterium]|nr:SbcC/MukB-like Walker B domain-containing protein [Acidimicrobiia bacterium]